jgi:hypothetical protein
MLAMVEISNMLLASGRKDVSDGAVSYRLAAVRSNSKVAMRATTKAEWVVATLPRIVTAQAPVASTPRAVLR